MKENIEENDRNVGWKEGRPVEHSSQTRTATNPRSGLPGLCLLESGELPGMEFALPLWVTPSSLPSPPNKELFLPGPSIL